MTVKLETSLSAEYERTKVSRSLGESVGRRRAVPQRHREASSPRTGEGDTSSIRTCGGWGP